MERPKIEKEKVQRRRKASRGAEAATAVWFCTHTFSGGDVNGAGDVRQAFVHGHLQVDDPATQEVMTQLRLELCPHTVVLNSDTIPIL